MKRSAVLYLLFLPLLLSGQSPQSLQKKASKAFGIYKINPTDLEQLQEAVAQIDEAVRNLEDTDQELQYEVWRTRAEIYGEISSKLVNYYQRGAGEDSRLPGMKNPALEAGKAWLNVLDLSTRDFEKTEALRELEIVQKQQMNLGSYFFGKENYAGALSHFEAALSLQPLFRENGRSGELSAQEDFEQVVYMCGLSAYQAGKQEKTRAFFRQLFEKDYPDAFVYKGLYELEAASGGPDSAYPYLEKGRKLLPENTELLFAEINHFMQTGEVEKVLSLLEEAMEAEPENSNLYAKAGTIYEQKMEAALKAGKEAEAGAFFEQALKYYGQYAGLEPDTYEAHYLLGSVHFNRAAGLTTLLNEAADDPSAEAGRRYARLKAAFFEELDLALPHFQEAEKRNPNHEGTLTALSHIYAQKRDEEMVKEFRVRLQKVQYGGKVEGSFFKK